MELIFDYNIKAFRQNIIVKKLRIILFRYNNMSKNNNSIEVMKIRQLIFVL